MAIISVELSLLVGGPSVLRESIESLLGITEIDTEALYRILKFDHKGDGSRELGLDGLYYALAWVKEEGETLPRVKVQDTKTGEEFLVPSILLEKLSPLESLGEQAE